MDANENLFCLELRPEGSFNLTNQRLYKLKAYDQITLLLDSKLH